MRERSSRADNWRVPSKTEHKCFKNYNYALTEPWMPTIQFTRDKATAAFQFQWQEKAVMKLISPVVAYILKSNIYNDNGSMSKRSLELRKALLLNIYKSVYLLLWIVSFSSTIATHYNTVYR